MRAVAERVFHSVEEVARAFFPSACPACWGHNSRHNFERYPLNDNARICLDCGHGWIKEPQGE